MVNSTSERIKNVAFIGLGAMGYPMAGHLLRSGFNVVVFNRTPEKSDRWSNEHQGEVATSLRGASAEADVVFVCVGNDDDLRSVCTGHDGLIEGMRPGSLLVDHTTTSAVVAREVCAIALKAGVRFLDAPVSGGQLGAEKGVLTVMMGGDEADFRVVQPVIKSYARAVTLMGEVGSGQLTKMVNQISIAGLIQSLSEALVFAEEAGLDGKRVVDVISQGAAQSWQMDNRGKTMLDDQFDFGFAVDWMRKDLAICIDEADAMNLPLPVASLVDQYYSQIQKMGGGRWDTSSLIKIVRNNKTN